MSKLIKCNFSEKKISTIHGLQNEIEPNIVSIGSLTTATEQMETSDDLEIIERCESGASRLIDLKLDSEDSLDTEITWTATQNHEKFQNIAT